MTHLTDDEVGALLTETFTAHEHLADPDRARALASGTPAARRRRAPVLLAAAASVALVAGGTSYLVSQRGDSGRGAGYRPGQTVSPTPSFPPIRTAEVTRAQAVAAARRVIAQVAVFPGADASNAAGVPELRGPAVTSSPAGFTVTRSRWWTVSATTPLAVAHWYDAHPTKGFVSDGGVGSTSGTGDPTIEFVSFHQAGAPDEVVTPVGVRVTLETTTTSAGVGIRATVDSVWSPARAAASFARDVRSIDVLLTTTRVAGHRHTSKQRWTIDAPADVAAVTRVFNRLHGNPPFLIHCPNISVVVEYRAVFRSPHGDLVVRAYTGCGGAVQVSRNGTLLPPALADPTSLVTALESAR